MPWQIRFKKIMTISRAPKPENRFAKICTQGLNDYRLSWKAKGILAYLLAKPDSWEVRLNHLQNASTDGRDGTATGLKELERFGYLERFFTQDPQTKRITGRGSKVNECPDPNFDKLAQSNDRPKSLQKVVPISGESFGGQPLRTDKPYSGNSDPIDINDLNLRSSLSTTHSSSACESENFEPKQSEPSPIAQPAATEPAIETSRSESIPVNQEPVEAKPTGRDDCSAAATRTHFEFAKEPDVHATERCDRAFARAPWGFYNAPDEGFLDFLASSHLRYVNPYKNFPSVGRSHARQWLNDAKRNEDRFEKALIQWDAYQEMQQRKVENERMLMEYTPPVVPRKVERDPELIAAIGAEVRRAFNAVRR